MPIRRAGLAVLAAALVAAPSALAGTPGHWSQLGQANLRNIDEVSLARTPDGTLHALWVFSAGANDTLVHDAIGPNGAVAPPNVVQADWASIDPVPDLVATSDGLEAFFSGMRSLDPSESNTEMNEATAPPSGAAWSLVPGNLAHGDSAFGSDVGVALLPDRTPLLSWGSTGTGVFTHRGTSPATPNFPIAGQAGHCCGYGPDIAVDPSSGSPFIAWISNATGSLGVFAQALDPGTAAPVGSPMKMPLSSTPFNGSDESSQQLQRVPIAARPGGGVYVAYPSGYPTAKKVALWRVPSTTASVVGSSQHDHVVRLAADPEGRIWVFWIDRGSVPLVFARRSNLAVTKFGPAVKVGPPKGFDSAYKIAGNAQSGLLDLVVLFEHGNALAHFHTQIQPGLAVSASPHKISRKKPTNVTFTVTDPDPVKGAKVSGGGDSGTTNAKGRTTLTLKAAKSVKVKITKLGYTTASLKLHG